jgi:HAMP domain-containing protein
MNFRLRRKIVLAALLPIVGLAAGTLFIAYTEVSRNVRENLRADLVRSAAAVEHALIERARGLRNTAEAMGRDPRVIGTLQAGASDAARPAADALAAELNARARFALFEIRDLSGALVATAGDDEATTEAHEPLLEDALLGRSSSGILIRHAHQYQATARPVLAQGRVAGALIIGELLGPEFASNLSEMTGSEVTFIAGSAATATTLERPADAGALVAVLQKPQPGELQREPGVPFEIPATDHRYLALSAALPESRAELSQVFAVERALDLETGFLAEARDHLLETTLVAILAALLLGFFVADAMARPIERVSRALEEVARGNSDYPLPRAGRDEIGDLVRSAERVQNRARGGRPSSRGRPNNMDAAA